MKRISKLVVAGAAAFFAVIAAPVVSTPAAAASAGSATHMTRVLDGSNVSPVQQVDYRRSHRSSSHRHHSHRHHGHRRHCGMVKRCWRSTWGHRKCRWVNRCR